jgi:periplasmic protein CpxP/Spy
MNTEIEPATPALKRPARRWLLAVALASAAGVGAMAAAASPAGYEHGMFGHHGHGGPMAMDGAALDEHVRHFIDHALSDGTPEQKAAVATVFKGAHADLQPIHEQLLQGHQRVHQLLTAPAIDRAAIEEVRARQMQLMDQASKRLLQAMEDAAEVLTPAQRARLAQHMGQQAH